MYLGGGGGGGGGGSTGVVQASLFSECALIFYLLYFLPVTGNKIIIAITFCLLLFFLILQQYLDLQKNAPLLIDIQSHSFYYS